MADCLSALPNDLLRNILSLIPEEEVGQKMILSKAWHHLVRTLTSVYIDLPCTEATLQDYEGFIAGYLSHCGIPDDLKKLVLKCHEYDDPTPINLLIETAVTRRVQILDLDVFDEQLLHYNLPEALFTSEHLQKLALKGVILHPPIGSIFTALTTLVVDISLNCHHTLQAPYVRYPALEDLSFIGEQDERFEEDHEEHERSFQVYSPTCKKLSIEFHAFNHMGGHEDQGPTADYGVYEFVIDAPRLQILTVNENLLASYRVINLSSIVEAFLQLGWDDVTYQVPDNDHVTDVIPLIAGLCKVQKLTMMDRTLGAVGNQFERLHAEAEDENELRGLFAARVPIFTNLKNLTLGISYRSGWNVLVYLLDMTPELEFLTIENVQSPHVLSADRFAWDAPAFTPRCLTHKILKVELKGIQGKQRFLPLVKYFEALGNGWRQIDITIT